jgi:hypothetical protein
MYWNTCGSVFQESHHSKIYIKIIVVTQIFSQINNTRTRPISDGWWSENTRKTVQAF